MISISDLYEHNTKAYYRANTWLRKHAKHKPVRKGRKAYWHKDDIAAFKARRLKEYWPDLLQELFAEPTTIYDALDILAERGNFIELDAIKSAVYTYERKGMLKKAGESEGLNSGSPRKLWVFVRD